MKQLYCSDYPLKFVTVDVIVYTRNPTTDFPSHVLLIKRKNEPWKDMWALPGGHIEENEDLAVAASRELFEETNINVLSHRLKQFYTYGTPNRDPRGHYISVVYTLDITGQDFNWQAGDDAQDINLVSIANINLFSVNNNTVLAADHKQILEDFLLNFRNHEDKYEQC